MISLPDIGATIRFKVAVDQAKQDAAQAAKQVAAATEAAGAGAGKGFLASLNSEFGRSSTLGQFAKLAAGGGAIFALSRASGELKKMADMGAELADSIRSADGRAGELAQQFAESLPVLGNVIGAGRSINEIITGDQAALKAANDEAAKMIDLTARIKTGFEQSAIAVASLKSAIAKLQFDESNPLIGKFEAVGQKFREQVEFAKQAGDRQINAILNPPGAEGFDALKKHEADVHQKLLQLDQSIAAARAAGISPDFEHAGASPTVGMPSGQDSPESKQLREQIQQAENLRRTLAQLRTDLKSRSAAAEQPIALSREAALQAAKNAGSGIVQIFRETGEASATVLHDAFFRQGKSPFRLLDDLKAGVFEFKREIGVAAGNLPNLAGAAQLAGKALFPDLTEMIDLLSDPAKKMKETHEGRPRDENRFPDLIRRGTNDALKLQFQNSRADNIPAQQLKALMDVAAGVKTLVDKTKPPQFEVIDL